MARLTGIGTKLRGSAGAWTYAQRGGETIAKQKVDTKGTSPRTYAQMVRRVQWGNLVNMYQAFRGSNRPSFEEANRRVSDFNLFIKANIGSSGIYLKKDEVRLGAVVVQDYLITAGSLPAIDLATNAGGVMVSDIDCGSVTIGSTTSVAALSAAIIASNGDRFIAGDKISCLVMKQTTSNVNGIPVVELVKSDLILDPTDSDTLVRDTANALCFGQVGTKLALGGVINGGAVYIQSRIEGGKTLVSTQRMVITNTAVSTYMTTTALNSAIVSYGGSLTTPYLTPDDANNVEAPVNP